MASRLRMPVLVCTTLSIALSIAVLACSADSLNLFNNQQSSNAWLLPVWPNHFDTRGLSTLVGTSVAILVLNAIILVALFVPSLPATPLTLISAFLSTALSLLALAFPAHLNTHAPVLDTLQTWTCRLSTSTPSSPSHFRTLCYETVRRLNPLTSFFPPLTAIKRFAFYATIPLLILQLLLLGTATSALLSSRRHGAPMAGDMEKGGAHELPQYGRQVSFEAKTEVGGSPKSTATEHARILPVKG